MASSVLVTGAGGFIGSAVVRRLVRACAAAPPCFADGSPVSHVVAVLRPGGSLERLQELAPSPAWSVRHADITDPGALRELLAETAPRAIMHLAFERQAFGELPESRIRQLCDAPLVSMFAHLDGVPGSRLIHTGSAWVLAAGSNLAEDAPTSPQSAYARIKLRQDALLPVLQQETGVEWINLRLFNVYGKYEGGNRLLPYLVGQLARGEVARVTDGSQVRDFTEVDDVARAYLLALQANPHACGTIYHIGTGSGLSVRKFAGIVAEVTGHADLIEFGSASIPDQVMPELVADPARARHLLGWDPPPDPAVQIRHAARWWLERLAKP